MLQSGRSLCQAVEYQFSTFDRTKAVATNVYGYLKDGYSEVCSTMIDAATDDAVNAWSTNGIKEFYDGSWNTSAPIGDVWEYYYRAIAAANYFIEHCPTDFPAAKYQEKYEEKLKELKLYPYETAVALTVSSVDVQDVRVTRVRLCSMCLWRTS